MGLHYLLLGLLVAALFCGSPTRIHALDLTDMTAVYAEGFVGETVVPPSPDFDPLGFGTLSFVSSGNGPPPLPTLDERVDYAVVNSGSTGVENASITLDSTVEWTSDYAIRAEWSSYGSTCRRRRTTSRPGTASASRSRAATSPGSIGT